MCLGRRRCDSARPDRIAASQGAACWYAAAVSGLAKTRTRSGSTIARGAEVHIDFAARDQQIDVVTFRNIFGLLQEIAQKDSRFRLHCGFDSLIDESVHAPAVESEIVLQELQVSLQDPVDLL